MSRRVLFVMVAFAALALAAGLAACTGGNGGGTSGGAAGGPTTADLDLRLFFGDLDARGRIDPAVVEVVVTLRDLDGAALGPPNVFPVDPTTAVEPLALRIGGVPADLEFLVRVVARDADGNVLLDAEERTSVGGGGSPLRLGLLPLDQVLSGVALLQPMISLEPAAAQAMQEADDGSLEEGGFRFIEETVLLYPVSPAHGYRVRVGNQETVVEHDGRFRLRPDAATSGTVTHPTDPDQSMTFQVADLTPGQSPDALLVFQIPFRAGCGMTPNLPQACAGIVGGAPEPTFLKEVVGALAEPTSENILNLCNMVVPRPTESSTTARGTYPDPQQFSATGPPILTACHNECEQDNGLIDPGSGGTTSYFFSTCHRFVAFGCCPNENTMSDLEQLANYPARYVVALTANLVDLVSGGRTGRVVLLSGPTAPGDDFACMDNHKGRECQQLLIGDITLDFRKSNRASVITPRVQGTVVKVARGETLEFVLHNNGCFGTTDVKTTLREIAGTLTHTRKETALTPGPQRGNAQGNELMLSSDPLLGNSPTFGQYTAFAPPAAADVTPTSTGFFGFGASTTTIQHFLVKPNVKLNTGDCGAYRYFCDVALSYTVPGEAQNGQRDTYVFTTDTCSVDVTFLVVDPSELPPPSTTPPPAPLVQADVSEFHFEHRVGDSPCPQTVRSVTITNTGEVAVDVAPSFPANSGLTATATGSTRLEPGASVTFDVQFDCSRTESYATTIAFVGTSVADGRTFTDSIPVTAALLHRAVRLDFPFGPFAAGTEIRLSRIQGGHIAAPDVCDDLHLHGETISIDGQFVGDDPNPGGCGYGKIVWTEGGAAP